MSVDEIVQGKVIENLNDVTIYERSGPLGLETNGILIYHCRDWYSLYICMELKSDDMFIVDSANRVVFGGRHNLVRNLTEIGGNPYLRIGDAQGKDGWYDEAGDFYSNIPEIVLNPIKKAIGELGLWDSFYYSCAKIFHDIDEKQQIKVGFLEKVVYEVNERVAEHKDNIIALKNSLQQFVQGLEYFIQHSDEALDFVGGGLRQ